MERYGKLTHEEANRALELLKEANVVKVTDMDTETRLECMKALRSVFDSFHDFLDFGMNKMGFQSTELQHDIAEFLENPTYGNRKMIQAARGQAKTTITALYAIWRLIQHPKLRCIIVTSASSFATDIMKMITDSIREWPELCCLRPDERGRNNTEKFDVHFDFKQINKSPSVMSKSVSTALAGNRADLIIGDDIENSDNSKTEENRLKLIESIDEFPDLANDGGDMVLLGTPQSINTIYKCLDERDFVTRIWTGRLPTRAKVSSYDGKLAPFIQDLVMKAKPEDYRYGLEGDKGYSLDPIINSEATLQQKELLKARFETQYMLCTDLSDADRYPIDIEKILTYDIDVNVGLPSRIMTSKHRSTIIEKPANYPVRKPIYYADVCDEEFLGFSRIVMAVDPAGGGANADETAYAVVGQSGSRFAVLEIGGVKGGYTESSYEHLCAVAMKWQVNEIHVEKNFGNGAYLVALKSSAAFKQHHALPLKDYQSKGQKEVRICDVLEPIVNLKALVINKDVISEEWHTAQKHEQDKTFRSVMYQLSNITRDKDSLKRDDRIDALAIAIDVMKEGLLVDTQAEADLQKRDREYNWFAECMGYNSWDEYFYSNTHCINYDYHEYHNRPNYGASGSDDGRPVNPYLDNLMQEREQKKKQVVIGRMF